MNEEILKWYISNIDEKKLKELLRYSKIKIKGFSSNKKKRILPPKSLVLKCLENEYNLSSLKKFLRLNSFGGVNYEHIAEEELIKIFSRGNNLNIVEFIISTGENTYPTLKKLVLDKINNKSLVLTDNEDKIEEDSEEIKPDNSEDKISNNRIDESLAREEVATSKEGAYDDLENSNVDYNKNIIAKLIKENLDLEKESKIKDEKIIGLCKENDSNIKEIKNLNRGFNKKINDLNQSNINLKKKLEKLKDSEERIKDQYDNLKKKYDRVLIESKNVNEENRILMGENEKRKNKEVKLKSEIKELKKIIENKTEELNRFSKSRIAIIGEIDDFHINSFDYDFKRLDVKKINNLDELLYDYEEVWVLLYDLSVIDQSKIIRRKNNYKVYKFRTFEELKNHMNRVG